MTRLEELTLALAGVFQAAWLVRQQATQGRIPEPLLQVCIDSVLRIDAPNAASVYGGTRGVRRGLEVLIDQVGRERVDPEVTRYVIGLMYLERKLARDREMLSTLRKRVERAVEQSETFSPTHPNVIANLGGTYADTLSRFRFRIMVKGNPAYLENPADAARVRALLLAGIRSVFLWRQLGGGRVHLLLNRKRILRTARNLLETIPAST